jgi:hypothetical protein
MTERLPIQGLRKPENATDWRSQRDLHKGMEITLRSEGLIG